MKPLFIFFLAAFAFSFTKAQDSLSLKKMADSSIKVKLIRNGKYSYRQYILDGAPLKENALESRLMSYPNSALELQLYKKVRKQTFTNCLIFGSISVAAIVAAGVQANQQNNTSGSLFSRAPLLCTISIGALAGEIIAACRSNKHLDNAVATYNSRH